MLNPPVTVIKTIATIDILSLKCFSEKGISQSRIQIPNKNNRKLCT
jgi:hypothetical protein